MGRRTLARLLASRSLPRLASPLSRNVCRRFFAKHSAVFFPKDVTLNYKKASAEYLRLWEGAVGGGGGGAGGGASAKQGTKPWTIADPRKLLDLEC